MGSAILREPSFTMPESSDDDASVVGTLPSFETPSEDSWTSDEDVDEFPSLYRAIAGPMGTAGEQGDNEEDVRQILRADPGAVNCATTVGWTPLMVSGSTGQPRIMSMLLRAGADMDIIDSRGNDAYGWTRHRVKHFESDIVLKLAQSPAHARCVELLDAASEPWSPATHHLWPAPQRARASAVLRLGILLAQRPRDAGADEPLGRAFEDVWLAHVLPFAVGRRVESQPGLPAAAGASRGGLDAEIHRLGLGATLAYI